MHLLQQLPDQGMFYSMQSHIWNAYIAIDTMLKNIQNSFGPLKVETWFLNPIFPSEKINLLSEYNEGKFYELFLLLYILFLSVGSYQCNMAKPKAVTGFCEMTLFI